MNKSSGSLQWLFPVGAFIAGWIAVGPLVALAAVGVVVLILYGQRKSDSSTKETLTGLREERRSAATHHAPFSTPPPDTNDHSPPPPPPVENEEWYYAAKGSREGPITVSMMSGLLEAQDIDATTLVWKKGMPKWIPFAESELAAAVDVAPPLPATAISNGAVWLLAFYPLIHWLFFGEVLNLIFATVVGNPVFLTDFRAGDLIVFFVMNTLLAWLDERRLSRSGYNTATFGGWIFIVPVYLFKRAKHTGSKYYSYFIVWLALALLTP